VARVLGACPHHRSNHLAGWGLFQNISLLEAFIVLQGKPVSNVIPVSEPNLMATSASLTASCLTLSRS
jgi:hypothetical protein